MSGGPAKDGWTRSDLRDMHLYEARGAAVYGHRFAMIKRDGRCDEDLVYIQWSSNDRELPALEEDVTVQLDVDTTVGQVPLTMIPLGTVGGITQVFALTNFVAGEKLLSLLANGKLLRVKVLGPPSLVQHLDIPEDEFSLLDFAKRRAEALAACRATKSA